MKIDIKINNQTLVFIMFCFFIVGAVILMAPEGLIQVNNYNKDCLDFNPVYFQKLNKITSEEIVNNSNVCFSPNQCSHNKNLKGCSYDGCNWMCCNSNGCSQTVMFCYGKTIRRINYSIK